MFKQKAAAAPAAEPLRVPSLSEVSPDYAKLIAKRLELTDRERALDAERCAILEKIATGGAKRASQARVSELLGDEPEGEYVVSLRQRLSEIAVDTIAISAARDVLEERIRVARQAASRIIVDRVRPEFTRRAAAVVQALGAAAETGKELERLMDTLELGDVAWVGLLPPLRTGWLTASRAPIYAKEAFDAGMISEIPEALR